MKKIINNLWRKKLWLSPSIAITSIAFAISCGESNNSGQNNNLNNGNNINQPTKNDSTLKPKSPIINGIDSLTKKPINVVSDKPKELGNIVPENQTKNVKEKNITIKDVSFDNSKSFISLTGGKNLANNSSVFNVDVDGALKNNFTFEDMKKLFNVPFPNTLDFDLEFVDQIKDDKKGIIQNIFVSINDFDYTKPKNSNYRLKIYSKKDNGSKEYLGYKKIYFNDFKQPTLKLKQNRANISVLGPIQDVGPNKSSLETTSNVGYLYLPLNWDNQGKEIDQLIKEQFILTEENPGTGIYAPKIRLSWLTSKLTHFTETKPPFEHILNIEGFDRITDTIGNKASYSMKLYVGVVQYDKPIKIIENLLKREEYSISNKYNYKLSKKGEKDLIEIKKSDIDKDGWDSVYNEIKDFYELLDLNEYDNKNYNIANIKFSDIKAEDIKNKNEINVEIRLESLIIDHLNIEKSRELIIKIV